MKDNIIKKIRFIPLWQEEKEIKWLNDMSKKGWHLKNKRYVSYWFEKGESCDYKYRYDYKMTSNKDFDEYKAIFEDSGWEYIDRFTGWHYFRARADANASDIYSDVNSKKMRFRRLLTSMIILACANSLMIINNILLFTAVADRSTSLSISIIAVWCLSVIVVLSLIYTSIRIGIRMKELKKSINE